ncbi:hypothetical protein OO013_16980 [Mangrovivirga sp. M17]|uniref:Uncharacterized protein n=1 Tax=Mangrovivirga halotolerans TaxID=2993936 RepID=A0ABT3RVB1_9BACT|nr:hypothetical protein [Mangrovivirga halotolerans]MCX2745578.1 hypothetical protein [Mangrovivirga halotolerans]
MNKNQSKSSLIIYSIFVLVSLVIIIDFILPGNVVTDEIIDVTSEQQQYYNAGGNSHYSHKVFTTKHHFSVAEDFAESIQEHEKIEYSVSRIFKEVNWYRLHTVENKGVYSLRIISGLIIPLIMIIGILVAYGFKKKISTLLFVLQVLLIADLAFLIL